MGKAISGYNLRSLNVEGKLEDIEESLFASFGDNGGVVMFKNLSP